MPKTIVLVRLTNTTFNLNLFNSSEIMPSVCVLTFLKICGVTNKIVDMIVMQHANNGSLLSYLDQNIDVEEEITAFEDWCIVIFTAET